MPGGGNAKRNRLSRAASAGGMLLVSSTAGAGEPGPGTWPYVALEPGSSCFTFKESAAQSNVLGEL